MSNTEILVKLRNLHEELAAINNHYKLVQQVDEETIDALGQLVTDAGAILDRQKLAAEATDPHVEGQALLERIQRFETDHPGVTRLLSQVTDVLAMMGI